MRLVLKNFRLVDEQTDMPGALLVEDGIITSIQPQNHEVAMMENAAIVIDGALLASKGGTSFSRAANELPVLMPAFVDLHAHFRDPGENLLAVFKNEAALPSEVLESASLSAAAGGFGTVICMANTRPPIDSYEKALALKKRSDALALIDLYPVMSLTKGMEGKELSGISSLPWHTESGADALRFPLMLSEDGKDLPDDDLFLAAMKEARRLGIPVSCHCDFGGPEAEAAKKAGERRGVWSRIEENNAVRRVIELGKKAGCHIHIDHVSTKEAVEIIRQTKADMAKLLPDPSNGFVLTCEVMPHNLCLTEEDAARLGDESFGRVNPPLRRDDDRAALALALADGTIDAIATDHAPHSKIDKEKGAPGFSGFETAFASVFTELVRGALSTTNGEKKAGTIDLTYLSSLMSARPARLLGFSGSQRRGLLQSGYRGDLVIIDTEASWQVDPENFKTRGKNSPFIGHRLFGKIVMTLHGGKVVFEA